MGSDGWRGADSSGECASDFRDGAGRSRYWAFSALPIVPRPRSRARAVGALAARVPPRRSRRCCHAEGASPRSGPAGSALVRNSHVRDFSSTVVFRWLAAGDAGDVDAFDELLHPDAVVHAPAGLSTTSADQEKAVWREARAAMPDLRHDVQEVVVDGHVEMARVVVTGTLTSGFGGIAGTRRTFRIDQAVITHLRDGKVAEAWEIADIASLKAQVSDA